MSCEPENNCAETCPFVQNNLLFAEQQFREAGQHTEDRAENILRRTEAVNSYEQAINISEAGIVPDDAIKQFQKQQELKEFLDIVLGKFDEHDELLASRTQQSRELEKMHLSLAEEAMDSCQGAPETVKRWKLFGRPLIHCTSPVAARYYYEIITTIDLNVLNDNS